MSITVTDPATGQPASVFLASNGGYPQGKTRSASQAIWHAAALARGLLARQTDGTLAPALGVAIYELGAVVTTPAVVDATGTITTPAVMDTRWHVDFQIDPNVVPESVWVPMAIAWAAGAPDTQVNDAEACRMLDGAGLIDPATIKSERHSF